MRAPEEPDVDAAGTALQGAFDGWADPEFVRRWASGDGLEDLLGLPRRMVAELVAAEQPQPGGPVTVLDAGSGPGAFLGAVLDRLPGATGIWTDLSPAMQVEARRELSRFGDRIRFQVVPLERLGEAAEPATLDLIVTSRVTHHLGEDGLRAFYGLARGLLRPGGWLANLDHVGIGDPWQARLRSIRGRLFRTNPASHSHEQPYPPVGIHLSAMAAAGLDESAVIWSAFWTALMVARRPVEGPRGL